MKKDKIKLGSLDPVRDFTYVKDTARGYIAIAQSKNTIGKVTNIGTGKAVTIGELAHAIINIIGGNKQIITDKQRIRPKNSEVMKLLCNNTKAKERANWEPRYSLEDGLKETIDFVRNHQDLYKPDIYNV